MQTLLIKNFKNSNITLCINDDKMQLQPLEEKTMSVIRPHKLRVKHWSWPLSMTYYIDKSMQSTTLKVSILRYQFSRRALIRIFWLSVLLVAGIWKTKHNYPLLGLVLVFGTMLIFQTIYFFDVLKVESDKQN